MILILALEEHWDYCDEPQSDGRQKEGVAFVCGVSGRYFISTLSLCLDHSTMAWSRLCRGQGGLRHMTVLSVQWGLYQYQWWGSCPAGHSRWKHRKGIWWIPSHNHYHCWYPQHAVGGARGSACSSPWQCCIMYTSSPSQLHLKATPRTYIVTPSVEHLYCIDMQ